MSSVHHGELSPVPREWARTIRRPSRQSSSSDSTTTMKILFLCTAHNSLSQKLFLALRQTHSVTIEYAVSDSAMIEAAALAQPDLIICPFLTARVPDEVHTNYLTLIVHPGPPGDSGPSAIDWVLMGDDGSISDSGQLLERRIWSPTGRSHWGVTVLQATTEFDAGPVWAFEQFELDIDAPGVTKSTLYRGPITRAAIKATLAALDRIVTAARWPTPYDTCTPPPPAGLERNHLSAMLHQGLPMLPSYSLTDAISIACGNGISPKLLAEPSYSVASVTQHLPFLGGATHRRPLLKASHRDFNIGSDNARAISRRIRSADSQPGCLTKLFGGISLYVYGGTIEEGPGLAEGIAAGRIMACKDGAVCIATCDGLGIWISHVRRVKRKVDPMLWPKVPAVSGLRALGLLDDATLTRTLKSHLTTDWTKARYSTHQEIWVDFATYSYPHARRVALVYFEFYNGAMSTDQCSRLIEALEFVSSTHTDGNPLNAVVLMGGSSYFSNGIALNVIEASEDPAAESWRNINRIDDVIHVLLDGFPRRNIMTVAAIRGNCAAGGVAMATACDVVIAGSETVLNPAYRALGLHGSEYHSLSYLGRCGAAGSKRLLRDMLPLSPYEARDIGLIDHTLPGWGGLLDTRIRNHIRAMVCSPSFHYVPGRWKAGLDVSPAGLATARTEELAEMAKDFWSARSERYHSRRRDFVRKVKPLRTPLRFASHRRRGEQLDEEESDAFDDVALFECRAADKMVPVRTLEMETQARQRASLPTSPPSNRGQVDCYNRDLVALPPLLIMEDKSRRDSGLVFPCLYNTVD